MRQPADSVLCLRTGTIDVAVAVVRDAAGRLLLAERTAQQISAGYWELPGGKIDAGETPLQAAARELAEEAGLQAEALAPWVVYEHAFPTRRIRLHFFRVLRWRGQPHGREGQRLIWADPAAPPRPLLPSNERALALLALPPLLAVTQASASGTPQDFLQRTLPALLGAGVRLLQVREDRLTEPQRVHFARRIAERARPHGARVLLAGSALACRQAGADGQHSTAQELRAAMARPPVPLWSASCRDLADVARAQALGADFLIVGPVRATRAHPNASPLGWETLARIAAATALPVYAQGGLAPEDLDAARGCGAVGVALNAATIAGRALPLAQVAAT
jgi:8-oxo-dGTP diphosphatase